VNDGTDLGIAAFSIRSSRVILPLQVISSNFQSVLLIVLHSLFYPLSSTHLGYVCRICAWHAGRNENDLGVLIHDAASYPAYPPLAIFRVRSDHKNGNGPIVAL
jgi:hypothetical protein